MGRPRKDRSEETETESTVVEEKVYVEPVVQKPVPKPVAKIATPKPAASSHTGKMALAREATSRILKKPSTEWLVALDYNQLSKPLPHIPTGSLIVDYLIGGEPNRFGVRPCPGLPRGRVSQIWGEAATGKTTLALTAASTCIAQGGTVLYVDWENDIVPDYAAALGIPISDADKFALVQPDTLEEGIKIATVYATAGVDLIIFDSVGAATPQRIANRELEDVAGQSKVGELQAVWSQELNNLKRVINKSKTAIFGISQTRAKISTGPMHGGPTTQPQGGNAWKFFSSIRLELRKVKNETSKLYNAITHRTDDRIAGAVTLCKVIKCKLSKSQGREEMFYISWGEGIDDVRSILEIGVAHGVIKKGGSWFSWENPTSGEALKFQGIKPFKEHMKAHPDTFKELYAQVIPFLGATTYSEDDMEDLGDIAELVGEEAEEELREGPDLSEPELDLE